MATSKLAYWKDAPQPRHQIVLFSETLEDRLPPEHPVRMVDEVLDQLDWSQWESQYNGAVGQPPIHPSYLCKAILFGIIRGILSSRKLEYAVRHSIDFIWLMSGHNADHSTLSKFRTRHKDQIKDVYRDLVLLALKLDMAKLSEICIDGTRVLANASRFKTLTAAKAQRLLEKLEAELSAAMEKQELNDQLDELFDDGQSADQLPAELRDLVARRDAIKARQAELAELDKTRSSWVKDAEKNPAQLPITDPDARILPNKEGGYAANYTPLVTAETGSGMIVDGDVLIGNVEHTQVAASVDRVQAFYDVKVQTVMADKAYSTGQTLDQMEAAEVELLSPMAEVNCKDNPAVREDPGQPVAQDQLERLPVNPQTKCFDKQAFIYVQAEDCYYCPAGKRLVSRGAAEDQKFRRYTCHDCSGCPLVSLCRKTPNPRSGRKIKDDLHEPARRRQRERMAQPQAKERYKVRQHIGETPMGVIKNCFGIRQFLLRGQEKVATEWHWYMGGFNLRRLLTMLGEICTASEIELILAGGQEV